MTQESKEEFLQDLLLTIPSIQDYMMIDWGILALWAYTFLVPAKTVQMRLLAISIVELLWGIYDLSIEEYAQSIPLLLQGLMMLPVILRFPKESPQ